MNITWSAIAGVLSLIASVDSRPMTLPFHETFAGAKVDPAWTTDVSHGNTITVENGALRIHARVSSYAHIQRPLGVDRIHASCSLKQGGGTTWGNALFLYWGPGDWCQISINGDGKHVFIMEMLGGNDSFDGQFPCEKSDWYPVAIELGDDVIRYQIKSPGGAWTNLAVRKAFHAWQGKPPTLLIAGKGYGTRGSDATYPAADLNNDFSAPGDYSDSFIRNISVVRIAPERARLTAAEREQIDAWGRDELGKKELAASGDPSYESVSRYFPGMTNPRETIGVKDSPQKISVARDASLEFGGRRMWFEIESAAVPFGSAKCLCAKRLVEGYLPMVSAVCEHEGLRYEQTLLGWSPQMSPDTQTVILVRLVVSNPGNQDLTAPIRLQVEGEKGKDGKAPPAKNVHTWELKVGRQASRSLFLKAPFAGPEQAAVIAPPEFQKCADEATAFWKTLLAKGMRIRVPEQRVNDAYRAWLAYNFLNVVKHNGVYEPHDGAGFYSQIFGYSAVLYCNALDLAGYHDEARTYLDSLLTFLSPDGLFEAGYGLPDHGAMLLALAEHYRLSGDAAWLRGAAPTMIRMCDCVIRKRREALAAQPKDFVARGLIKDRPYADHGEPAYSYYSDCYLVVGMEAVADALSAAGMAEQAARIGRESAAYRRDVLTSMDRATIEYEGMKILPIFPETQELLKRVNYTARDYYSIIGGTTLETRFLPAADPRFRLCTEFVERRGGLLLGVCAFGDGIDHAYTYGYWLNCLERGRVKRAILGFYSSLAYGMTRETYAAVEGSTIRTGENALTLPDLYSNTQQLRLLRNMLLREDGDRLLIGQAIPRPWLEQGKQIVVENAPTAFGKVGYRIDSCVDQGRLTLRIDPPSGKGCRSITVYLRHPRQEPIQSATANGRPVKEVSPDCITLTDIAKPIVVEVRYR